MGQRALRSPLREDRGSVSVEFVVIFLTFISIIFFVIEVTLYMFFQASLEKAAQAGARAAIVSAPVVNGVRLQNNPVGGNPFGNACGLSNGTCASFTAQCSRNCSGSGFQRILRHMQGFNGAIARENVTIRYEYAGAGFAGGPTAPMVTVTVSCVPFRTGILRLIVENADDLLNIPGDGCNRAAVPPRSASMTGEDLAQ
jgi:Flp pilus assembly protein TadG